MMGQTVQSGVGHDRIWEQGDPVLRGPVAVNDHRGLQMSFSDNLIEILGLSRGKGGEAEVIDDQQLWPEELLNPLLPGVICPGSVKASEHFNGLDEQDIIAFPAGFMTDGLGQMGLPHPGGAIDKDMLFPLNEQAGGQVVDQSTFDLGVKREIKPLQGLLFFKRGPGESLGKFSGLSALYLILKHELEKSEVTTVFLLRFFESEIQGFQKSSQPEDLQLLDNVMIDVHGCTSGVK
jgi:hypothetical protein